MIQEKGAELLLQVEYLCYAFLASMLIAICRHQCQHFVILDVLCATFVMPSWPQRYNMQDCFVRAYVPGSDLT